MTTTRKFQLLVVAAGWPVAIQIVRVCLRQTPKDPSSSVLFSPGAPSRWWIKRRQVDVSRYNYQSGFNGALALAMIKRRIENGRDVSYSVDCDNDKKILVELSKNEEKNIILKVIDEGKGFKEKSTKKIFDRFYSNRPDNFGEHSGLGLNIVKNLVDLHNATINASNNINQKGANVEIIFPKT